MKTKELSLDEEIEILVKVGMHKNKADLLREALRLYREAHPDKKIGDSDSAVLRLRFPKKDLRPCKSA